MRRLESWGLLAATLLAGCQDPPSPPSCGDQLCTSQQSVRQVFQSTISRKFDLLVIADDTEAVGPYREKIATGYAELAGVFESLPHGPGSLHATFIPASLCGQTDRKPLADCALSEPTRFLKAEWCSQDVNFTGEMRAAFSCLGDFGIGGCAPAQPLAALRRLLSGGPGGGPLPGWEGFLRPDAYLGVVIIAGEDDASGSPGALVGIAETVTFLRGLKRDPDSQIFVSVVGPGRCPGTSTVVCPHRFGELHASFGNNAYYVSLESERVALALVRLTESLSVLIGPMCISARDADPAAPGVQATCVVTETLTERDGSKTIRLLPSCTATPPPCWRLSDGPGFCGESFGFTVDREASFCAESSPQIEVECLGGG